MEFSFIVIDDSELDCFIAKKVIMLSGINKEVKTYFSAIDALEDITTNAGGIKEIKKIILLDLMIPQMDGLEFIEAFEKLPQEIQDSHYIVALTASRNNSELSRLASYKSVNQVIEKPFTDVGLRAVINTAFPGFYKML